MPLAFMPMTTARRRRNHRANIAPVVLMEEALMAVDSTKPNMKIRKKMWKVRLCSAVITPMTARPPMISLRPPVRSKILPMKG